MKTNQGNIRKISLLIYFGFSESYLDGRVAFKASLLIVSFSNACDQML